MSDDIDEELPKKRAGLLKRLRGKSWWRGEAILAGVAVVIGLVSAMVSNMSRVAHEAKLEQMYRTKAVIVAAKDVPKGTSLNASNVSAAKVLAYNASQNVISPDSAAIVYDKRVAVDLKRGDVIYLSAVEGAVDADKLSEKVPPGKRLFTLNIQDKSLAYGWIKPNDHVDILAHLELPGRGSTTLTVLQDVTLVSVGSATILAESGKINGGDISFFVDPEEYELLSFAEQKARFSISLRNPKDLKVRDSSQGIDMNAFLDSRRIKKASGGGALDVIEEGQKVKQ